MADFGFGIRTDLLCSPAREFVFPALHIHEKKMGLWEQLPTMNDIGIGSLVGYLFLLFSPRAKAFAQWYQGFLEQAIANNTPKSSGIFGPVIQSGMGLLENPGHNYAQMIGEGSSSTFSAADAYGIMISGFFHYLSRYPNVYERLASDIRRDFKPEEEIVWGLKLESCIYLCAVIDEVMCHT
ncbi:hypothetical protein RRF57_011795 [Xylaria bambusicola]|uniref:Uncharacterized protein n=1 Tax=Xylaria bambusicola TaxID=326684 RepID=A0AAN7ZE99_9PEZI